MIKHLLAAAAILGSIASWMRADDCVNCNSRFSRVEHSVSGGSTGNASGGCTGEVRATKIALRGKLFGRRHHEASSGSCTGDSEPYRSGGSTGHAYASYDSSVEESVGAAPVEKADPPNTDKTSAVGKKASKGCGCCNKCTGQKGCTCGCEFCRCNYANVKPKTSLNARELKAIQVVHAIPLDEDLVRASP